MGLRQVWICGTVILHAYMNSLLLSPLECACISRNTLIISVTSRFQLQTQMSTNVHDIFRRYSYENVGDFAH